MLDESVGGVIGYRRMEYLRKKVFVRYIGEKTSPP